MTAELEGQKRVAAVARAQAKQLTEQLRAEGKLKADEAVVWESDERGEPLHQSRNEQDKLEDDERMWIARRHFPHLTGTPRESDEVPTHWED